MSPPDDQELYGYFGRQQRWLQLILAGSFSLAAISLTQFAITSPWLWPLLVTLAISVCGNLTSLVSGFYQRTSSRGSHEKLIASWPGLTAAFPSVDVYLPTCGEDLIVLRNTYRYVALMEWPGELNVWVLDDGDRAEVRLAAAEFGFHYVARTNRPWMKKAGNLQYAFERTNADIIAILDADFVPRADYLQHLVPYLDDPAVGIVQSPQVFETERSMTWLQRTAGATQELFYRWVQPARDRVGAAICVGTCALYRRSALDATDGFAQIEHSEDVHTGIFLLKQGYRTHYVPALVSRGLCPADLAGFLNQQYRWCNGSLALLTSGHALRSPLNLRQKICFLSGFFYYISTAVNVFVVQIPCVVMGFFFAADLRAAHFVPFLAGAWVYFVLLPRIVRSRWRLEVLRIQMAYSLCHAVAILHKIRGRTAGWVPTGASGRSSSVARSVSKLGLGIITCFLALSFAAFFVNVPKYGLHQFWPMALFLGAYTYIAAPLGFSFAKLLLEDRRTRIATIADHRKAGMANGDSAVTDAPLRRSTSGAVLASISPDVAFNGYETPFDVALERLEHPRIPRRYHLRSRHQLAMIEAIAYTLIIGMIAALASGWFDTMLPWSSLS